MKLLRNLPRRSNKKGRLESWGVFKCPDLYCGQEVERQLSNGKSAKSCGCNQNPIKHGETHTKLYMVWNSMKQRVLNPNHKQYKDWGGRGIMICPEWTESYIVFKDWSLSHGYAEGLQINRINNDGNYEPSNCNFVTQTENNRNTIKTNKTSKIMEEIINLHKTGNYTYRQLAHKYNVSKSLICSIIRGLAHCWIIKR